MNRLFGTAKTNVPSTNVIVTKSSTPQVDQVTSFQSSITQMEQQITIKRKELEVVEKEITNYVKTGEDILAVMKMRKKKAILNEIQMATNMQIKYEDDLSKLRQLMMLDTFKKNTAQSSSQLKKLVADANENGDNDMESFIYDDQYTSAEITQMSTQFNMSYNGLSSMGASDYNKELEDLKLKLLEDEKKELMSLPSYQFSPIITPNNTTTTTTTYGNKNSINEQQQQQIPQLNQPYYYQQPQIQPNYPYQQQFQYQQQQQQQLQQQYYNQNRDNGNIIFTPPTQKKESYTSLIPTDLL